jgi:hypothetical protein
MQYPDSTHPVSLPTHEGLVSDHHPTAEPPAVELISTSESGIDADFVDNLLNEPWF